MTPLWTAEAIAAATGGSATRAFAATGVSIDTRTLMPGDLFVALTDRRDGHDFVAAALAAGAAGALVARRPEGVAADAPLVLVADVMAALASLGAAARARTRARMIAVTGSAGKTSTKEMLRCVLAGQGRVHAAEASLNNHWGVPLTLARMPADAEFAVIEIGMNSPGEIAPLSRLARPDVALVTTVGAAHLGAFPDIEAIAREKAGIVAGLVPGGTAILPADIDTAAILRAAAEAVGARIVTFGAAAGADWRLVSATPADAVTVAHVASPDGPLHVRIASPGRHFAMNAVAALAATMAAGGDPGLAVADLGRWAPPGGRGGRQRIALDPVLDELTFELIDDAYNANPLSVAAALEALAALRPADGVGRVARGRRIAILGDMAELGAHAPRLHAALARHPAMAAVAQVHCVGPLARSLWQALPVPQRGEWVAAAADLLPRLRHVVDAGDIVLVKGSRATGLEVVVDALARLGQGGARSRRGGAPDERRGTD